MDAAAFEALIARNEELAARRPTAYQWRVFGLAALGYLYLALVVGILLALLIAIVAFVAYLKLMAIKLLFVVGAPLVMVLRALRVRLVAPTGTEVTRSDAPDLHRLLDDLRRPLRAPRLHHVVLTNAFNAGITQVPRLGLFGWHRNYLLLGLPLMKALTVEQFRAVLAHELGHLSGGHARAGNWIYRLRVIWQRLDAAFTTSPQWGSALIRPFFKRYVPFFSATSFPLARSNEYQADATSLRLTSARSAAQALTAVNIVDGYLTEKYWPDIQAGAKDTAMPAFSPYRDFSASAIGRVPEAEVQRWLQAALNQKTSHADTHPCLTDRLRALGAEAEFAPPTPGQSAECLLGTRLAEWERCFDEGWREHVSARWKQIHERAQANRVRLENLRAVPDASALQETQALELADLEEEVGAGTAAALTMRRSLAEKFPESLPIRFALARQLLLHDDPEGVQPMESVVNAEPQAVQPGAQILRDFYARQHEATRASYWQQIYLERSTAAKAAQEERRKWLLSDTLAAHELPPDRLPPLTAQLRADADLVRAYLVRKVTKHSPQTPMYILGFTTGRWWNTPAQAKVRAATHRISQEVRFPGETLIVNIDGNNWRFARMLRQIKGSRII